MNAAVVVLDVIVVLVSCIGRFCLFVYLFLFFLLYLDKNNILKEKYKRHYLLRYILLWLTTKLKQFLKF